MKRFLASLAIFTLVALTGHSDLAAGLLPLLGVGGGATGGGGGPIMTPSATPLVSAYFDQNQSFGLTNNGLKPNGGVPGSTALPVADIANSVAFYGEFGIDSALSFSGQESPITGMSLTANTAPGLPSFNFQRQVAGIPGTQWWLGSGPNATVGATASPGAGYFTGFFPFTATGSGCARDPSGVWFGGSSSAQIVDPGFGCPPSSSGFVMNPAAIAAAIPGSGAQQPTGLAASPVQAATTCAVVTVGGVPQAQVTVHLAVAHGVTPGMTFPLQGFSGTGFSGYNNASYTALPSTTGSTLIGTTGGSTCPTSPVDTSGHEGTALSGIGASITLPAISTTNPLISGATGITTRNNQKICFLLGVNGDDSPFPGAQFLSMVDEKGVALPGSPALVSNLNQGTANFTGYTVVGAQSPSSPALSVTTLNAYSITGATFNPPTGYAHFTVSSNPGFIPGSEFKVSSVTSTGPGSFNLTYVAVAGTSGTTIMANPLSGPGGTPQVSSLTGSSVWSSGGSMASVILPGMTILGGTSGPSFVLPYGTFSGTGTGGVGTYALSSNQASFTFTVASVSGAVITVSGTPATTLVVGDTFTLNSNTYTITALGTGTGSAGTYTVNTSTGLASGTATATGAIGSSGSPVSIFAYPGFYYTAAASPTSGGGVTTLRSSSSIGDMIALVGGSTNLISGAIKTGWGGEIGNFATIYGPLPTQTGGAPSTSDLASICTKHTDIQAYAQTKGLKLNSLYRLNDPGINGDSGNATVSGYIDSATGTSGGTATLHVLATPYGSLALTTGTATAKLTGVGLPVSSPTTIPLTTSAGSSYTVTFPAGVTSINLASSGSPIALSVGAFNPASPIAAETLQGYIDTTAGVSTLHVTSLDNTGHSGFASFTGSLTTGFTGTISGTTLTITSPLNTSSAPAVVGIGTTISGAGVTGGTVVTGIGTGVLGLSGTYTVNNSQTVGSEAMTGSGLIPGAPTTLTVSGVTGAISQGMAVTDGGASLTGQPLVITGGSGSVWTVGGNYYPSISNDATMVASLTAVVPGAYFQNSALLTPAKVVGFQPIGNACNAAITGAYNGGPGCYTLAAVVNAVGSSGSPATFTGTSISDGGAIAPGPALTISDQGPGVIFPITNYGAGTGSLFLSGAYDVPTLGGTPTAIQAQVSLSANGPPIPGCSACAWANLSSGVVSGGTWSGQAINIPGGGPYYVSVRAANGTAYATLPSPIKVGLLFGLWGQGQADSIPAAQSGYYTSWFSGLWGYTRWNSTYAGNESYLMGPPITGNYVPGQTRSFAGNRFGVVGNSGNLSEATGAFDQNLTNAFGFPASMFGATRDGVGAGIYTLGNAAQTQTVGVGDGLTLTWCSASKFCGNSTGQQPLTFNAASLTGGWFSGSVSGSTLTATTRQGGALMPGMVLSGAGIIGSPTLVRCLTGCATVAAFSGQTWQLSASLGTIGMENMNADVATGTPWPYFNLQSNGSAVYAYAGFGTQIIKAGSFTVNVNGSVVCQDTQAFAYNNTGSSSLSGICDVGTFVNYQTGDYQIVFTSGHAPASGAAIIASWTNIISPQSINSTTLSRVQGIDFFGDGGPQSGADSALFAKAPGGMSGHIFSGMGTDKTYMMAVNSPSNGGYQFGGLGYSEMVSWLFSTKFPTLIPGAQANVPFFTTGQWRVEGPQIFTNISPGTDGDGVHDQWTQDIVTKSLMTGHTTAATGKLTLDADTTYPMWEGEVLGCVTLSTNCNIGPLSGNYITGLASGAWGKSGSTYTLGGTIIDTATSQALQNAVYYTGVGPAYYLGTLNDIIVQNQLLPGTTGRNPHPTNGFTGGARATRRWAAMIWGQNGGNASDPKLSRANDTAAGTPSPAFDYGNTYAASATGTVATVGGVSVATFSSGLSAHARPFVVGQWVTCSGCTPQVVTAVSLPPTQSTRTGESQIGQSFTVTMSGLLGVTGSAAITAGCHSGSGSGGSNCINIDIGINVGGTFGTGAAIDTCGANNLNGNAPNYVTPNGACSGNGVGEIVRAFRIGTNQFMYGNDTALTTGDVFDDGVDLAGGAFNQSAAFTCNIVAAKIVQCVKGPAYSSGLFSSVGKWTSGSTFISYGDLTIVSGRIGSMLGYVGGQSFPFTAGSGYTPGTQTVSGTGCGLASSGAAPKMDITIGSGGSIVNAVPANASGAPGLGVGTACTFTPAGGTGGSVGPLTVGPVEGTGGIATYNTDSNTMGMFLYDNSGEPGNPLNAFFTNGVGGYFEPGLPVRPFGEFQGAAVGG